MNLHLNENKITEKIDLERLLDQIKDMRNLKGLSDNKPYWIYPVMWGQHDELKRVNEYVKENYITLVNTFPYCFFYVVW